MKFNGTNSSVLVLANDEVQAQWHIHENQLQEGEDREIRNEEAKKYIKYFGVMQYVQA